jgi:hypothetical protein
MESEQCRTIELCALRAASHSSWDIVDGENAGVALPARRGSEQHRISLSPIKRQRRARFRQRRHHYPPP